MDDTESIIASRFVECSLESSRSAQRNQVGWSTKHAMEGNSPGINANVDYRGSGDSSICPMIKAYRESGVSGEAQGEVVLVFA